MCGLSGIISFDKAPVNISHFDILGTLNDERGGDSCGIFIDGNVKYGVEENKKFRDFTKLLIYPETFNIALIHCRWTSSINTTSITQAQPVCIYNESGKIDYVLMHNGTIYNSHALADKYLHKIVDITGMSDSQIMANIFYYNGYDVLNEYIGTAAFVIVDYRNETPEVLFFKGDSEFNPEGAKEERPLYCMFYDNKLYFSSMTYPLNLISRDSQVYIVPVGKLCKLIEGYKFQIVLRTNRYHFDSKLIKKVKKKYKIY